MLQAIVFYTFSAILVLSALMVISARNPVHSVLFLILGFFNAAGLFVMLGAEFIAMILVIVYVGAVAVLFLFVVMMLDISFADLRKGAMQYVPLGIAIGAVLLVELFMLYKDWAFAAGAKAAAAAPVVATTLASPVTNTGGAESLTNTEALGLVIYTDYLLAFQVSGLILLVAMIGAIVLTLRTRPGVYKQKVADQFARNPEDVLEIKKVTPGTGVSS